MDEEGVYHGVRMGRTNVFPFVHRGRSSVVSVRSALLSHPMFSWTETVDKSVDQHLAFNLFKRLFK
jgi:hypothetical protein